MKTHSQIPTWLETPADSIPRAAVSTRLQELPFVDLSWENFERLCLRLAKLESNVEHCQLYGNRGQKQHGIDLYARYKSSEGYCVYQCKREKNFTAAKIRTAVTRFRNGQWFGRANALVLCATENLVETRRAEEVEKQSALLTKLNVEFIVWDAHQLSVKLKTLPRIVDDFFGRECVKLFCGGDAVRELGSRLDGRDVAEFRRRLGSFYGQIFNKHDPGLPSLSDFGNDLPLPIEKRFVLPDVDDKRIVSQQSLEDHQADSSLEPNNASFAEGRRGYRKMPPNGRRRSALYEHRQSIDKWLATRSRCILLGGPGSGKSSLLRFLVTDLFNEEPHLQVLAEKWGQYLPIWVPFAYWTKKIASSESGDTSFDEALENWLTSWGEGRLWPIVERALQDQRLLLFVDGLDEYTNEAGARLALSRLQVFAEQRGLPVVATSRPRGFDQLNVQTAGWEIGRLSDFSLSQQEQLARIWFEYWTTQIAREDEEDGSIGQIVGRLVESFNSDLRNSTTLQELAKTPLLLSVLLVHKRNDVELPPTRFKAYESLIDHLLFTHPKKRWLAANLTDQSFDLSDKDLKLVLANLAFRIQQDFGEGIVGDDVARDIVVEYLRDPETGFGLDAAQARKIGTEVLQIGENTLGLIVKRSHSDLGFLHRTFQEYLAAAHLARIPLEKQLGIVDARCTDPQWRESILALLYLTSRSEDVEKFVNGIQQKSVNAVEKFSIELLLGEVAFGDFSCGPILARSLAQSTVSRIESGWWMPHREKLLRLMLEGLRSTKVREFVKAKLSTWFPDRTRWNRDKIFQAMGNWELSQPLEDCLIKGLYDESSKNARAAAKALAVVAGGKLGVGKRIVDLAWGEIDPKARAVAIECLLDGFYQDQESVGRVLATARSSAHPVLRLVAISGKVIRSEQTNSDLQELFFLASFEADLNYDWRDKLVNVLVRGWSGTNELKRTCLDVLQLGKPDGFDRQVAAHVLVDAFPQDNDVAQYFAEELNHEYFSVPDFFAGDKEDNFFDKLARNFKNHPFLAPAADRYCQRNLQRDYLTYYSSALVGHSNATKKLLLACLHKRPRPIVSTLLRGWAQDSEVREQLSAFVFGPSDGASVVGDQIPAIINNKNEARARLFELLKDPTCTNKATVISGLMALDVSECEREIVDIGLELIEGGAHESVPDALIQGFSVDPRVRELAKNKFTEVDGDLAVVASVYGADTEIRHLLIQAVNPIPSTLRGTIVTRLSEGLGDDEFVLSLLKKYTYETDSEVKVEAALGYYNRLKRTDRPIDAAIAQLRSEILTEFDMRGIKQAAFCGLVVLGRLDVMKDAKRVRPDLGEPPVTVPVSEIGERATVPFLRTLLENWNHLQEVFQEQFWFRFAYHSPEVDSCPVWRELCLFADEYPQARNEALSFFEARKTDKEVLNLNVLGFLDRAVPKSRLLLDYCMSALSSNYGKPHYSSEEAVFAVELIGKHFASDDGALRRVMTLSKLGTESVDSSQGHPLIPENFILALCEGWPRSDEMRHVYEQLCESEQRLTDRTCFQLASRWAQTEDVYRELRFYFRRSKRSQMVRYHSIARFIVRRLKNDEEFANLLLRRLGMNPNIVEKGSIPRLVGLARGVGEVKQWCVDEIEKQLDGTAPPEVGIDVVESGFRPVVYSLCDAINLG